MIEGNYEGKKMSNYCVLFGFTKESKMKSAVKTELKWT